MTETSNSQQEVQELKRELAELSDNCKQNFETLEAIMTGFHTHLKALYENMDYLKEQMEGKEGDSGLILPDYTN